MRMDAVNENVAQLINLACLQVDLFRCLLTECSLFPLKLFFQVNDLSVTVLYQGVVIYLKVCDYLVLALARGNEILDVLAKHSVFLLHLMISRVEPGWTEIDAPCDRINLCPKPRVTTMKIHFGCLLWDSFHADATHLALAHIWLLLRLLGYCMELSWWLDWLLSLCHLRYVHV